MPRTSGPTSRVAGRHQGYSRLGSAVKMAAKAARCSRARERWALLVRSVSRGDDVLWGGGCFPPPPGAVAVAVAVAHVKMAGLAEAAPGGGDGGGGVGPRRGSPPEPLPLLLQTEDGQPRQSSFASGGDGQSPPHTETLGFYESDRHRKQQQRRALSGKIPLWTPKHVQSASLEFHTCGKLGRGVQNLHPNLCSVGSQRPMKGFLPLPASSKGGFVFASCGA